MSDCLAREGDYTAPTKGRTSLYALFSLAAERTRTCNVDDEEASFGCVEEDILSLGKAASMQVASDESKLPLMSTSAFSDALSKDPNLSLGSSLVVKRRSTSGKARVQEETDTTQKPWRATNDLLHKKSSLREDKCASRSPGTLSPTMSCGGAGKGARRWGRISAPRSPKHPRSPIKIKTHRLHKKNTQSTSDLKNVLNQGSLWELYELRSDDSDYSDNSDDEGAIEFYRPSVKHTLPCSASVTNKATTSEGSRCPVSKRDSSIRWISSLGKANKSSSSLQLPTRFISPNSSAPKRRVGAQMDRSHFSKGKGEMLRSPFAETDSAGL
jgi:hypothetical protein